MSQVLSAQQKLMAIFAHPDDELTVAPVLSKYVREGAEVYLVIATDGRLGTNDHSGLEAGDGLAEIRREEMKCAATKLGVRLIHLNYHDQLRAGEGYDGHMPHARALIKEIDALIDSIHPNAIITFGPDGGSNHMDHRLIGATVTSVVLNQDPRDSMQLFYVGTPGNLIDDPEAVILRGVHPAFLNVQISFSREDATVAIEAIKCHESQFEKTKMVDWLSEKYKNGLIFLREFQAPLHPRKSIFR